MKAMILAAGYGTRLRPLTYTLPKPMVPLCNQPLIGWAVQSLLDAGIRDLVVNLHHLPQLIEEYLPAQFPDARIHFSFEPEILGTGGGVRNVRSHLENEIDFFLLNGDTVQFPRFGELRAARQKIDALAALSLRHPPADDRFTPVWFDGRVITGFGEGRGEALIFSGAHVISSRIFSYLPATEFSSIVDDVYRPLVESGREPVTASVTDGPWFDIGTPQRYLSASRSLLALTVRGEVEVHKESHIEKSCIIHDSAQGQATGSVIGARSVVEGDVVDSVIWDDCRIARGAHLESCIVSHGVEIKTSMQLSKVMICTESRAISKEYQVENGLVIVPI